MLFSKSWSHTFGLFLGHHLFRSCCTGQKCGQFSASSWFISAAGTDSLNCGDNSIFPCKTLDWLLSRFYNTSFKLNYTFSLHSDVDLSFNKAIQVCLVTAILFYFWIHLISFFTVYWRLYSIRKITLGYSPV